MHVLMQDVLHCLYISIDVGSHRLILLTVIICARMLHENYGHQGLGLYIAFSL